MCGRYEVTFTAATLIESFGLSVAPGVAENLDLRPTEQGLVVRHDREEHRECVPMRWGLVPHWAKSLEFGSRTINARAETLATARAFAESLQSRRCIVPASAFFEWSTGPGRQKVKHRISLPDGSLLGLAGLWSKWRGPDGTVQTFTIITTEPSAGLRPIHDRMPVILEPAAYDAWLNRPRVDLLVPYPHDLSIEPPFSRSGPLFD